MEGGGYSNNYANPSMLSESLLPNSYNRSTVDMRASSTKARRTARRQMHGSHLDDCAKMEVEQLSSRLVSYRAMYLATGAYCSCTSLITPLFRQFMKDRDSRYTDEFTLLIQAAWVAKPLFAFLSDWIFPFNFRIKGYVVVLAIVNAILCIIGAIHVQKITQPHQSLVPFQMMTFFIFVNLAFVDSICQGMTTITLRLEQRLVSMQVRANARQPSLIKNYMSYLIVRQIAGSVFILLASYLKDKSSTTSENDIAVAFILISILSIGCALQALLLFSEFKQSSQIRKGTTFKGQFSKFKAALIQDGGHVLLLFTFLTPLNPYSSIDFTSLYSKVNQTFNNSLVFVTEPITSVCLALCMIYLLMKRIGYFSRSVLYVVGFYSLEIFIILLNFWSWPEPPSQAMLVTMFILQVFYSEASTNASLILVIQSVAKHCEEGVESFSINMVTCAMNLGGLLSGYATGAIQDGYLSNIEDQSHYEKIVKRLLMAAAFITLLFGLVNFVTVIKMVPQHPEEEVPKTDKTLPITAFNSTLRE